MTLSLRRRRGLTLIELTVVLLVLAATAGILIPRLVNYGTRAHGAAGAANFAEIAKAIMLFETNKNAYPNNWDSLLSPATGTGAPTQLYDKLNDDTPTATDFQIGALSAAELTALTAVGITTTQVHRANDATGFDATFGCYQTGGTTTLTLAAAANQVVELTATGKASLNLNTANRYLMFGLGSRSNLVGEGMIDAPVHYPEGAHTPATDYSRFVAVFQITDGANVLSKAKLASVASHHEGALASQGDHVKEYFESTQ